MPISCGATVLMATAVTEPTVSAKPVPSSASGGMNAVHGVPPNASGVPREKPESQYPAAAIRAKPAVRTQRGATWWMSQPTTGMKTKAGPWMKTNSTPTFQVSVRASPPTATDVLKHTARNANMPITATIPVIE